MSSKTIYDKVQEIKTEKDTKIIPGNIKKDVTVLGVTGTLEPSADINIFTQTTEPTGKEGIWLDTNKTFDNIEFTDNVIAGEEWNTVKMGKLTNIPYNFYSGGVVSIGTDVYLFGGESNNTTAYKYNTLTDTYTQLTDTPVRFDHGSIALMGTDIYLFGGNATKSAYKYNTLTDTYTQLANIPYDFYSGSAVAVGTDIYLLGGGASSTYLYKYDTTTDTYRQMSTSLPVVYTTGNTAVSIGAEIYIFGVDTNAVLAYKYDTTTDTYTQLANVPYGLTGGNIALLNADIYLFGAVYNDDRQKAYKYDTLTDTYTQLDNIPYNFYAGQSVSVKNEIYLFGGVDYPTKVQVLDVITVDFEDKSIVVQNGTGYRTQLYTNNKVEGRVLNYFSNVYTYTDLNGLQQIYNTYYGNGTSWVQID